nr:hypothetical protein [Alysiella crassa]UOP06402.1 hypothetical protein LVJ80_11555 [Alysiella crassa]
MTKPHSLLPQTPWQAKSRWSFERQSLTVLLIGLTFCGLGEAMLVLANLGAAPWVVFAQGLAKLLDLNIGITTLMISAVVMLLWIPLHLRVGLGTLTNIAVIALVLGFVVAFVPAPSADNWLLRGLLCVGGVVVIGVAAAVYLTCHMGAAARWLNGRAVSAHGLARGRGTQFVGKHGVFDWLGFGRHGGRGDLVVCLWRGLGGADEFIGFGKMVCKMIFRQPFSTLQFLPPTYPSCGLGRG